MLAPEALGQLVNKYALQYGLRPDVIMCVVLQESKGDTFSWRWEEGFYERRLRGKRREDLAGYIPSIGTLPTLVDELLQRSCSFGLMQVLGDTARWCGKVTSPYLAVLHDPERGLDTGCKVFSFYLNRAKEDYRLALKYYNGSWAYSDEVMERVEKGEHITYLQSSIL